MASKIRAIRKSHHLKTNPPNNIPSIPKTQFQKDNHPMHHLYHSLRRPALPVATLLCAILCSESGRAALSLPSVFGDHMVLQAERPATVWGQSNPSASIEISFVPDSQAAPEKTKVQADAGGKWIGKLPALKAGEHGKLVVVASNGDRKEVSDVLTGEVWLASGQSNMAFPLKRAIDGKEALQQANQPEIRLFNTARRQAAEPQKDIQGSWVVADETTVAEFSAVAWFFGFALHQELKKPVGLIQSSWGGTPVETWIPPEDMKNFPEEVAFREALANKASPESQQSDASPAATGAPSENSRNASHAQNTASHCYNAMIHGLEPFTLSGVIWYQGEANSGRPEPYRKLFPALITSWRRGFQNPDLPFFYVELAAFDNRNIQVEGGMAVIRECQQSALSLPHTGVATAVDVGDAKGIHPKNKHPVGQRLALLALGEVYGRPGLHKSPQFSKFAVEGKTIRLWFDDAEGLQATDSPGKGFVISGKDGVWHDAQAKIENDQVVVWSDDVPVPSAVRYGWENCPSGTLKNRIDLPLRPFRTGI